MARNANGQPAEDRVLSLPLLVNSPVDVSRLLHELEQVDGALLQAGLRASGGEVSLPHLSRLMNQTTQLNTLNLLRPSDRVLLQRFLTAVRANAPVMHMSFSTDPSPAFIEKLISWLRQEIHPEVLLSIGLQPTIGAGCTVRTKNKYFDFSLRQDFFKKSAMLRTALRPAEPSE